MTDGVWNDWYDERFALSEITRAEFGEMKTVIAGTAEQA